MRDRASRCALLALATVALATAHTWAAVGAQPTLLTTERFTLTFPGIEQISAMEVRGLVSESNYSVDRRTMAPVPSRQLKPVIIVIVRRAQEPDSLWDWRRAIMSGKQDLRTGRIHLLDAHHEPVLSFVVLNALPYKWVWPKLNAVTPEVALEEIHLVAQAVLPDNTAPPKPEGTGRRAQPPIPRLKTGPP